jgi:hypothetical protein
MKDYRFDLDGKEGDDDDDEQDRYSVDSLTCGRHLFFGDYLSSYYDAQLIYFFQGIGHGSSSEFPLRGSHGWINFMIMTPQPFVQPERARVPCRI